MPDIKVMLFLTMLIARMADPINFIGSSIIGILSKSLKKVLLFSSLFGILLAFVNSQLARTLNIDFSLVDGWIGQIISSTVLAMTIYLLKLGWKRLKNLESEMDDCQAYFSEVDDPNLIGKNKALVSTEPVKGRASVIASVKLSTPNRLNPIQRAILSTMMPVLAIIGLNALAIATYYEPYNWGQTWWIWMPGLGALTWFEVWLWRD